MPFSPLYIGVSGATIGLCLLWCGLLMTFSPLYIGVSGATQALSPLWPACGHTFSPLYIGVSGATFDTRCFAHAFSETFQSPLHRGEWCNLIGR